MLQEYIRKQMDWSRSTFGEGPRTVGICKHIESELQEIQAAPTDLLEWVDIMILAFDGAWRAGYTPEEIIAGLLAKQDVNFARIYQKPTSQNEPSFHVRMNDAR